MTTGRKKQGSRDAPVRGRGRCPRCRCRRTTEVVQPVTPFYGRTLEICANCAAAWEPLPPGGTHLDDDGHPLPFADPCDNCAFRPGSPEQQDTAEWKKTMASLKRGAGFYCHKGVPIDPACEHGDSGFAYPRGRGGKPARRKLRLCRGYLNMLGRHWRKADAP